MPTSTVFVRPDGPALNRLVVFVLAALAFMVTLGCKYSRISTFKDEIGAERDGFHVNVGADLIVEFTSPILQPDDVLALGYPPTRQTVDLSGIELWIYDFESVGRAGQPHVAFSVTLAFKDRKLSAVRISQELSRVLPADVVKQLLHSLGAAKVDVWSRTLRIGASESKAALVSFPNYREVARSFGPGFVGESVKSVYSVRYDFICRGERNIKLSFVGYFREHFDTMVGATVVFGNAQLFFGEGFVGLERSA